MTSSGDVKFQLPNGNEIIVENCNVMSSDEILENFKCKYVYFSSKCRSRNLHFKISGKEISQTDFPLKNIPRSTIVKAELNGNYITLIYDGKEFNFSEKENVFGVTEFISNQYGKYTQKSIYIQEEGTNNRLKGNYQLKKSEKYKIIINCPFEFRSKTSSNHSFRQIMDFQLKVIDAQRTLQIIFCEYGTFNPDNIIIYDKDSNPITDSNKFLRDIQDPKGVIWFDIKTPASKSKTAGKKADKHEKNATDPKASHEEEPAAELVISAKSELEMLSQSNSKPRRGLRQKKVFKSKIMPVMRKVILSSPELLADSGEKQKEETSIKVDFVFEEGEENNFSQTYDINTCIGDILKEIYEKCNVDTEEKKAAVSYKEGTNKIFIDNGMSLEDIIDEMKEEPKTKDSKPRNVLYVTIFDKFESKRSLRKSSKSTVETQSDDEKQIIKTRDQDIIKLDDSAKEEINRGSLIEIHFVFDNIEDEKYSDFDQQYDINTTIGTLEKEINEKYEIESNKKIIISYKEGGNKIDIDRDMTIEDVIDKIKEEKRTKKSNQRNILYVKICDAPNPIKFPKVTNQGEKIECERKPKILDTTMMDQLLQKKQKIGVGASSTVYRVKNTITGEGFLAVKIINNLLVNVATKEKKDFWDDDDDNFDEEEQDMDDIIPIELIRPILREWEILTYLDHPNIIKTYGFYCGDASHPPAIVLEYCKCNLENSIVHLENIDLVRIVYEICSAIQYLHKQNIIHRDIKVNNILINKQKNAKVCDFGISRLVDAKTLTTMTHGVGSLKYMAPELFDENSKYDEKVDVYAFGVVLYFIVTRGHLPKISHYAQAERCEIPKSVTDLSKLLINKCLSYSSKDRPSFDDIIKMMVDNQFNLFDGIKGTFSSLGIKQ